MDPVGWRGGVENSSHDVQLVVTEPDLHWEHVHVEVIQQGERSNQIQLPLNLRTRDGEQTKAGPIGMHISQTLHITDSLGM